MGQMWHNIHLRQCHGPKYIFLYASNPVATQQELLVAVCIQSALDGDSTRQMLPEVWVMLDVAEAVGRVRRVLLFLDCQVNYKVMEPQYSRVPTTATVSPTR